MNVVSSNICGGLGNMMFQIATGYSISLDEGSEFIIDETEHFNSHQPLSKYKNTIFKNLKFSQDKILFEIYNDGNFHYSKIPKFNKNIKLSGFFQSEKYFKKNKEKIFSLYEISDEIKNKLQRIYGNVLKNKTCSLHVRRGDYVHLNDYHPILPFEYYKKAYDIIGEDFTYLIFSNDIEYCKDKFEYIENKIFIENLEDYEDLYLMTLCNNNIIANSTFSWWGAWLNKNVNRVIAPSKWFGPKLQLHNTKDIYAKNWIII
jgi:hypothetical protein